MGKIRMVENTGKDGVGFSEQEKVEYAKKCQDQNERIMAFMQKEFGDTPFFMFYEERIHVPGQPEKECNAIVGFNGGKKPSPSFISLWIETEKRGRHQTITGCFCGHCK